MVASSWFCGSFLKPFLLEEENKTMSNYARLSVAPRSIAWFIRDNDWDQLFAAVKQNCAFIGGAANLFVLVREDLTVSREYWNSLRAFDPDVIVLSPGQTDVGIRGRDEIATPFAIFSWSERDLVGGPDPWGWGTGENAKIPLMSFDLLHRDANPIVATWDPRHENDSRLSVVACGDLEPREPMIDVINNTVSLDAVGARERFLHQCLQPGFTIDHVSAAFSERGEIDGPPNLVELSRLISDE